MMQSLISKLFMVIVIAIILCVVTMSDARPAPPQPAPAERAGNDDILDGCTYRWGGLKCPETTAATTKATLIVDPIKVIEKLRE